jgi:predicted lipoprotein with Yx(FWY)xxD motif
VHRMRIFAVIAALGFGLAACSNSSSGVYGAGGSGGSAAGAPTTVGTSQVGDLGTVLVDGAGLTLYMFQNDKGSTSTCTGSCASTWPALTTSGNATTMSGADSSLLGTTQRDDGSTQVTYNGHPLYLYSGDSAPGDANGEGIGNVWYAVSTQGTPAMASGGGNGGGYGNGGGGGGGNDNGGYGNGYG